MASAPGMAEQVTTFTLSKLPQRSGPGPTISVDQYTARLARGFSVSAAQLTQVLPTLHAFAQPTLELMR